MVPLHGSEDPVSIVWKDHPLSIKRSVAKEIVTAANALSPYEICGVLAGETRDFVTEWHQIDNVHEQPERFYQMDVAQQVQAFQRINAKGIGLCGIFHSHTKANAKPSQVDIEYAAYSELFYVILSLNPRELRAWSMDFTGERDAGDEVWEHRVVIEHGKAGLGYCWVHDRYEDSLGAYRVCFECQHVFRSELELVERWNKEMGRIIADSDSAECKRDLSLSLADSFKQVPFCPCCGHDW